MLKKSFVTLAGAGSLLLSSLALAQNSIPLPAKAEYRTVIASNSNTAPAELKLSLLAVTLPPARIASPFEGFDFNTALIITGDPELNISVAKWTLASGTLPAGLTLSSSGQLTGVPTETATTEITLEVNYKGKTAIGRYTVRASGGDVRIEQYPGTRYYEDGTWPKDCQGYMEPAAGYLYEGATGDGIYRIQPGAEAFDVNCNMTYEGGGWTVFQSNTGAGDFNRTWAEYEAGFGALTEDHWIGLQRIHDLMKEPRAFELYAVNLGFGQRLAEAATISDAASQYTLAGDWMFGSSPFSTFDRDNDSNANENCAQVNGAGYWFPLVESSCDPASILHLNSNFYPSNGVMVALMTKKLPPPPPPPLELEISSIPEVEGIVGDYLEFDFKPYVSISEGELDWSEVSLSLRYIPSGMTFENGVLKGIPTADMECCSNRLTVNYGELSTYYNFSSPMRKTSSLGDIFLGSYFEKNLKADIKLGEPIDDSMLQLEIVNKAGLFPNEFILDDSGVLYGTPAYSGSLPYNKNFSFDLKIAYKEKIMTKSYTGRIELPAKLPVGEIGQNYYLDLSTLDGMRAYQKTGKEVTWTLVESYVGGVEKGVVLPPGLSYENNIFSSGKILDFNSNWGVTAGGSTAGMAYNPARNSQTYGFEFQATIDGKLETRVMRWDLVDSFGIPPSISNNPYSFDLSPLLTNYFINTEATESERLSSVWFCDHSHGIDCSEEGLMTGTYVAPSNSGYVRGFLPVTVFYRKEGDPDEETPITGAVVPIHLAPHLDDVSVDKEYALPLKKWKKQVSVPGTPFTLLVIYNQDNQAIKYYYGRSIMRSSYFPNKPW